MSYKDSTTTVVEVKTVVKLRPGSYEEWKDKTMSELQAVGAWRLTNGKKLRPVVKSGQASPLEKDVEDWEELNEKACGIINRSLDISQAPHLEGKREDTLALWKALEKAHADQKPNTCFFALQKLLNNRKAEEDSLSTYITCLDAHGNRLKALIPSTLTAAQLIDEIIIHASVIGLDDSKYGSFTTTILNIVDLDKSFPSCVILAGQVQWCPAPVSAVFCSSSFMCAMILVSLQGDSCQCKGQAARFVPDGGYPHLSFRYHDYLFPTRPGIVNAPGVELHGGPDETVRCHLPHFL